MTRTRILLMVCVIADVALVLGAARARRNYGLERGPFRAGVTAIALPSGYRIGNTRYAPSSAFRCALIQFTSIYCPSCDANWQRAAGLSRQMMQMGCTSVRLAPSGGELPVGQVLAHEVDLEVVDPGWLEDLPRLEMEPTTIVLGPGGKILWYAVGKLTRSDARTAVDRVRAALRSPHF